MLKASIGPVPFALRVGAGSDIWRAGSGFQDSFEKKEVSAYAGVRFRLYCV